MNKNNIYIRGGKRAAEVLRIIQSHGIQVDGMCFADDPEHEFGFGTKVFQDDTDLVGYCDRGYFERLGYTLVTPDDFLRAWCPDEYPCLEESICDLIDQKFNIKIIL